MHNYSHKRFTIVDAIRVSIGYFLSSSVKKVFGDINHFEHMILFIFIVFISIKVYNNIKRK